MKNLNICIDIDGTLTNPYYWLDKTAEHFNKIVRHEDFTQYEYSKVIGISQSDYDEFYEKYKFKYHSKDVLRFKARDVINKFYLSNNVFFVTAREKSLEMLTFSYLNRKNIKFDRLFVLGTHHKVKKAKELKCDVFIEDNPYNAEELSNAGFKVFLIDTTYNRKISHHNIIRVYDWIDIEDAVNNLILAENAI
ncbi:5' nucleotidase, NT5C type [Clostridium neuense]|uniref:Nucleotidase n=1 Tax=Clostridium neuense TaxID=1728934 RepID=A0ABW8T9D2_9CLOT